MALSGVLGQFIELISPVGVESNRLDDETRVGDGFDAVVEFLHILATNGSGHLLDLLHHSTNMGGH